MSVKMPQITYDQQRIIKKIALSVILFTSLLVIMFPIYWMISTGIRSDAEIFSGTMPYIPRDISLEQMNRVIFGSSFPRYYANTIIYSLGVVSLNAVASALGGYGLARLELPVKKVFARLVLFGYMFSPILLAIPMFILWRQIGLIDTYIGMILALTGVVLPFSLWIMWKFFQTVPESLEESAQMSGATRFEAFLHVALPMAKPGILAVSIFAYASTWNAFTIPLILAPSPEMYPLTVGINEFQRQATVDWGAIMAGVSLSIIPSILFVYFLQKHILEGFKMK